MAAGDGNRVWFPEMIETLRARWNTTMPFPDLIELCTILDGMFQRRGPEVESCLRVLAVRNAAESWVPKVSNDTASASEQLFCRWADSVSPRRK
jgi:hypothetical protein